jgi:putative ABC transport system permease protein
MPNLTIIDVGNVLAEVRQVIDQASAALQLVFVFCVLAGLVVLLACVQSMYDERQKDVAVLRALGAKNRELRTTLLFEWVLLGGVSGFIAGLAAMGIGYAVSQVLFDLPGLNINWLLPLWAALGTAVLIVIMGLPFLRRLLRVSTVSLLREE